MSSPGNHVAEWLEVLTTADATERARARGVKLQVETIAELLADLGLVPKRDGIVQVYRVLGCKTEVEFWGIKPAAKPGEKTPAADNSLRALADKTGYSVRQLQRRRSALSNQIAAQVEVWGEPPKGGE